MNLDGTDRETLKRGFGSANASYGGVVPIFIAGRCVSQEDKRRSI
jgi:hypothetical protein